MLSDIHFDPYRDPAKVPALAAAPIAEWDKILAAPPSDGRFEAYKALEAACKNRGEDSDFDLFRASLKAEKAALAHPQFITLSGDLLVHQFDCRYRTVMKSDAGYASFAEKTANFVIRSLQNAFPQSPVFVAMGNNDSACGDYKMDPQDAFFKGTADAVLAPLKPGPEADRAHADYLAGGFFAASLPGLSTPTRLLVIDDIFLSRTYHSCSGKPDATGSTALLAWLTKQLDDAAARHERVWIMGHIPPGVNVYSSLRKGNVCKAGSTESFLQDDANAALVATIANHASVIPLTLFGHTHMDEIKLIGSGPRDQPAVPMKGVASISPVNGNVPSFTVGQIDPATSGLTDYTVYTAPNADGSGAWKPEYSFDSTYKQTAYSPAAIHSLANSFLTDVGAASPASSAYERFFMPGFPISPLVLGWKQYACSIDHLSDSGFESCACTAAPRPAP
jgi:sphingomyelin phosphodiesterase acid-like 3